MSRIVEFALPEADLDSAGAAISRGLKATGASNVRWGIKKSDQNDDSGAAWCGALAMIFTFAGREDEGTGSTIVVMCFKLCDEWWIIGDEDRVLCNADFGAGINRDVSLNNNQLSAAVRESLVEALGESD